MFNLQSYSLFKTLEKHLSETKPLEVTTLDIKRHLTFPIVAGQIRDISNGSTASIF